MHVRIGIDVTTKKVAPTRYGLMELSSCLFISTGIFGSFCESDFDTVSSKMSHPPIGRVIKHSVMSRQAENKDNILT